MDRRDCTIIGRRGEETPLDPSAPLDPSGVVCQTTSSVSPFIQRGKRWHPNPQWVPRRTSAPKTKMAEFRANVNSHGEQRLVTLLVEAHVAMASGCGADGGLGRVRR